MADSEVGVRGEVRVQARQVVVGPNEVNVINVSQDYWNCWII